QRIDQPGSPRSDWHFDLYLSFGQLLDWNCSMSLMMSSAPFDCSKRSYWKQNFWNWPFAGSLFWPSFSYGVLLLKM
ncbi:hypothetical protein, partial [Bacteroides uniformis]|uniref:hypothetical protein n=1 Tax=Bacteroides uniformis TaxID=820 RepID=UPI001EDFC782